MKMERTVIHSKASIKPNKPKSIQLNSIGRTYGDVKSLNQTLIANLKRDVIDYHDLQSLVFDSLMQISPVNKDLQNNEQAIEEGCKKVMAHLGMSNIDLLYNKHSPEAKNNFNRFCQFVLFYAKAPAGVYKLLLLEVNADLIKISELIKWYESGNFIARYIAKKEQPRTHEEGTQLEFYQRCLKERIKILEFQLYGLRDRAVEKAGVNSIFRMQMTPLPEVFYDRPYHFSKPFAISYFDVRLLDKVEHRLSSLPWHEGEKIRNLYSADPKKFYYWYFRYISVKQHFQNFDFYFNHLPIQKDRKSIFQELAISFSKKHWNSFYALALLQIEGLFSEMCTAIDPNKNLGSKALPDKVNIIRPHYSLSQSYFDYYQFHIPSLRNRFAHTGYESDLQLKSYDLLSDLLHLLSVFASLDNPLVKIKQLQTRRAIEDFISIEDFVYYFKLLDGLKSTQRHELRKEIDAFEKDFLITSCNPEFTAYEFIYDFPREINDFVKSIDVNFSARKIYMDFGSLNEPQILKVFTDVKQVEIFRMCFIQVYDEVERFGRYSKFLQGYKKYLSNLSNDCKKDLDSLWNKYRSVLGNIGKVYAMLQDNASD